MIQKIKEEAVAVFCGGSLTVCNQTETQLVSTTARLRLVQGDSESEDHQDQNDVIDPDDFSTDDVGTVDAARCSLK